MLARAGASEAEGEFNPFLSDAAAAGLTPSGEDAAPGPADKAEDGAESA